ncbi:NAD(P)-binding protein [Mytilinidion resinicola]|uniref:NAD(P)-binding protein n=1 Tax=Mytilinidion resinicola TaxID=574789 RepID=A0A6A6YVM7_9PEZI|nr:NAD(P)-binding protein [Mytilinidion resinicola]KAF2813002.1 NAD(P)-binding protein [Mytilinidion resinicola]
MPAQLSHPRCAYHNRNNGLLRTQSHTILITGAGGFIGQALAAALLDASPACDLLLADLGLAVNIDSRRLVLDHLRGHQLSERTIPVPQSSYGAEKLVVETLVSDYSHRGLIDGRVVRLQTVIVRPGAPSAAASSSSFASGIVREPLKGERSVLPVGKDLDVWVCSPSTVVRNLVAMKDVPKEAFGVNRGRTVNLPGQTVMVGQILEALEAVGERRRRR